MIGPAILAALLAYSTGNPAHRYICTNSAIFSVPPDASVVDDRGDVETAAYAVIDPHGRIDVIENSIARQWTRAHHVTLPDGRMILKTSVKGKIAYAFARKDDERRPLLIVTGDALSGDASDFALLGRFQTTDWGEAEQDKRCTIIVHYGWDNVLGPTRK